MDEFSVALIPHAKSFLWHLLLNFNLLLYSVQLGEVSLWSWSPVLQAWIQLLHYIQIRTYFLFWSYPVFLNWRPAIHWLFHQQWSVLWSILLHFWSVPSKVLRGLSCCSPPWPWSSLVEGDEDCIGPRSKLLCLWQIPKIMQHMHGIILSMLTFGPFQLVHLLLLKTSMPLTKVLHWWAEGSISRSSSASRWPHVWQLWAHRED